MSRKTLSDDFQYKGNWWLPEKPANRLPGVLSFNEEGIRLELFGLLEGSSLGSRSRAFQPPIILGHAGGKPITLYHSFEAEGTGLQLGTNNAAESPQLSTSTFIVQHMFVGKHFESATDLRFPSLSVRFTYLEEWMGTAHRPFEIDHGDEAITAIYSFPDPIEVRVESIAAEVSITSTSTEKGGLLRSLVLEHNALILIVPDMPQDFDWYQQVVRDCQNLLTLLVGRPTYPQWITAHVRVEFEHVIDGLVQRPVEVFSYHQSKALRSESDHPLSHWNWSDVLVPLPAIESSLESVFEAWFAKADDLRPIYDLYFGTLYSREMYVEFVFLALCQALESFHSRTSTDKTYFPDDEYRVYSEAMRSALPEKAKRVLGGKLRYLNYYTLKERLDRLLTQVTPPAKALITDDPDGFTTKIKDARNWLTHYDERLRSRALKGEEYPGVNARLRLWLMVLLLLALDIDSEKVTEAAKKYRLQFFPTKDLL